MFTIFLQGNKNLVLLKYFSAFWAIILCSFGIGRFILNRIQKGKNNSFLSIPILFGLAFLHTLGAVFQLYFNHLVGQITASLILVSGSLYGIYFFGKNWISFQQQRIPLAFLTVSFFIMFFPFIHTKKEFFASEETGDHTIYFAPIKLQDNRPDSLASSPKWKQTVHRALYETGMSTRFPNLFKTTEFDESVKKAKWDLDPVERIILEGFSPGWWSLHWSLFPIHKLLCMQPETLYFTTLLAIAALISLQLREILMMLTPFRGFFLNILAFFSVLSPVMSKTAYNHFYLQLVSLSAMIWIFRAALQWKRSKASNFFFMECLSSFLFGPSFYFLGTAVWLFPIFSIFAVFPSLLRRLKVTYNVLFTGIFVLLIYFPVFFSNLGSASKLASSNSDSPESVAYWNQVLGPEVKNVSEILTPLTGTANHRMFYFRDPFRGQIEQNFMWMALLHSGAALTAAAVIFRQRKKLKPILNQESIFLLLIVILGVALVWSSKIHKYNFNKSVYYLIPFIILAAGRIFSLAKNGRFSIMLFLILWGIPLAKFRILQIDLFHFPAPDTQSAILEISESSICKNRQIYFFYPEYTNQFSLLETFLAGCMTVPVTEFNIPTFRGFLAEKEMSKYKLLVKHPYENQFTEVWTSADFLQSDEKFFPIAPEIDWGNSVWPIKIYLKKKSWIEAAVNSKSYIIFSLTADEKEIPTVLLSSNFASEAGIYLVPDSRKCELKKCEFVYTIPVGHHFVRIENIINMNIKRKDG